MKKINMLPMCKVKTEYKKFVMHKNEINFYVSHANEILFIFWHAIMFLLLCDNKNMSPWHNILSNVQNKNLMLHKK